MKKSLTILFMLLSLNIVAQDTTDTKLVTTVDQLIEKYSPKIEAGMAQLYDFTKTTGEEAIKIFYKYLLFKDIFWLVLFILLTISSYALFKKARKLVKDDDDEYDVAPIFFIFSCGVGIISVFGVFQNIYDLLFLLIAPEIRLLKEILYLIK